MRQYLVFSKHIYTRNFNVAMTNNDLFEFLRQPDDVLDSFGKFDVVYTLEVLEHSESCTHRKKLIVRAVVSPTCQLMQILSANADR
jgi:hypothetical protein